MVALLVSPFAIFVLLLVVVRVVAVAVEEVAVLVVGLFVLAIAPAVEFSSEVLKSLFVPALLLSALVAFVLLLVAVRVVVAAVDEGVVLAVGFGVRVMTAAVEFSSESFKKLKGDRLGIALSLTSTETLQDSTWRHTARNDGAISQNVILLKSAWQPLVHVRSRTI